MAGEFSTSGFSDALVILGAAGIVIPAFARIRISPIIGFILIVMLVGPGAGPDRVPARSDGAAGRGRRRRVAPRHDPDRRRDRGGDAVPRPVAPSIPVRPGGADQEPGAAPVGLSSGGDCREPGDFGDR